MVSPWEIVKDLCEKTSLEYDLKDYIPWIINKTFVNSKEHLFFAEQMNRYSFLDKGMQKDFYFFALPKKKKYIEYERKSSINTDIDLIMKKYKVNHAVAESYLKLLSEDAITALRITPIKGGKT